MRPADQFAKLAAKFDSRIDVVKDDLRCDGKSVLSIMTLGAGKGTQVALEGCGPDAESAVNALANLVESGFGLDSEEACVAEPPSSEKDG